MTKVILFNGPPGCGKDTAAIACTEEFGALHAKFASPMKNAICGFFGFTRQALEQVKDEVCPFSPTHETWRQVIISFAEEWAKHQFGPEIHGKLALVQCAYAHPRPLRIVVSDSGFVAEVRPWVAAFQPGDIALVKIRRPGKDFSSDSRSYIKVPQIAAEHTFYLDNDGTMEEFREKVVALAKDWFKP